MATFVLNDETKVNSYGFRILNKGIDLERFNANPVMLAQHINSVWTVIGRWVNLRIEGDLLLADSEFDMADPDAAVIAGKVERGFIKACSMGILWLTQNMKLYPDQTYVLELTELMENSIVAVPSNANALRLFAETGELLDENQIQLSLSAIMVEKPEFKTPTPTMEKLTLPASTLTILGVDSVDNFATLAAAINTLAENAGKANQEVTRLTGLLETQKSSQANALVDTAITEGRLTADVKEEYVEMAKHNYELAAKIIAGRPAKQSLLSAVNNPNAPVGDSVKTVDDFEKLTVAGKLAWKHANPDKYDQLFGEE